ncbi:MAG: RNA methyltransferase [Chitinophagaceae bacterium]|nr:MAG: RNA methyltransferase [Chitinophagaceae bacterium]
MTPERSKKLNDVLNKRQPGLSILLENVHDPHNISAVMRTCDAVGIQDIYILNTQIPKHKKWGARSSSSAAKWLTVHQFNDTKECFTALRKRFDKIYTTHLGADAVGMHQLDLTQSVALVPQVGIIQSLNISVACAVTLYEAFRQKTIAGHYDTPQLKDAELQQLKNEWGFIDGLDD